MRSLTFKWIVTLLLTSLVGVVLVGAFAYRATATEYDRLRVEQSQAVFVREVTAYYEEHGSWAGLEEWLAAQHPTNYGGDYGGNTGAPNSGGGGGGGGYRSDPPQLFALVDANGVCVVGHGPFNNGQQVPAQDLSDGVPIVVDGEKVGTALLAQPPPQLDPREQRYLDSTNKALLVGAIGASALALLIGVLLSRTFLRPLSELTRAITAMQQGDLNQQVQVRTKDELGALAQTFNQMSAQIHRANQLRKQMTADIAHDLRTPLMVISGYLEALRDGTLQPTQARFDAMNKEAVLLNRLIEDLRTLSLADAGELKLIYQSIPPRELLEQVRQSFEPLANDQRLELSVAVEDNLPALTIDRERMAQVLGNLVTNALRYTPVGGTITLRASSHPQGVQLAVSDTGSGIAEEHIANIFERFYRTESSRYQGDGDTESGLGLAIAKSIVEAHHGTIGVESKLGVGSTFRIILPRADK